MGICLLSGCAPAPIYHYDPPVTVKGTSCIKTCEHDKEECLQQAEDTYIRCVRDRDLSNSVFEDCSHVRGGTEYGGVGACAPVQSCPPPQRRSCIETYNDCYTACGGTVTRN